MFKYAIIYNTESTRHLQTLTLQHNLVIYDARFWETQDWNSPPAKNNPYNVLNMFNSFYWGIFMAVLGCMQPKSHRLDTCAWQQEPSVYPWIQKWIHGSHGYSIVFRRGHDKTKELIGLRSLKTLTFCLNWTCTVRPKHNSRYSCLCTPPGCDTKN